MKKNHIYIGDNLTVMNDNNLNKLYNSVKMIYIDPPYNTKSDKSYSDKIDSNDWAKFMYDRLVSSLKFLKEDGCIFISIDDNEYANLKLVADEVFGKKNFVGTFITLQAQRSNAKHINTVHEYILCYAKNKNKLKKFQVKRMDIPEDKKMIDNLYNRVNTIIEKDGYKVADRKLKRIVLEYCDAYNIRWLRNYCNVDSDGKIFFAVDLSVPGEPRKVDIKEINLKLEPLRTRGWVSDKKFIELYEKDLLYFKNGRPYSKLYLEDSVDSVSSCLRFFSRQGTNDLKKLGLANLFDTPKPVEMLKFLIRIATEPSDVVMDYFAGSGTLAQAVYEVNVEDGRKNNYILIQIDEKVNEKSDAYKECIKRGINPDVSSIMLYRIDYFLNENGMKKDYDLFYIK